MLKAIPLVHVAQLTACSKIFKATFYVANMWKFAHPDKGCIGLLLIQDKKKVTGRLVVSMKKNSRKTTEASAACT